MAIRVKSPDDIEKMARAGMVLMDILRAAARQVRPGLTTGELDASIRKEIEHAGAEPVMLGYRGQDEDAPPFAGAAAICLNEEVVHAVPGPRIFREGDIATIDCALRLDGWCADAAIGVAVGEIDPPRRRLLEGAGRVLQAAIAASRPGIWWSEVVAAAARAADAEGLWLLPDFAGHGIGRTLHELPAAGFELTLRGTAERSGSRGAAGLDFLLRPGMTFTVEPVLTPGRTQVLALDDGWTMITADRSAAAHEERTLAVTASGVRVLTG
jgi:methionyl aminopeptidase